MTVDPLRDEPVILVADTEDAGLRLDSFLAARLPRYSRVQLRRAVVKQYVTVDDSPVKAAHRLRPGQRIVIRLPDAPQHGTKPEEIPLDILYEDDVLVVVNKPPGMVVHPARGHWSGTLAAALAFRFEQLSQIGGNTRPGIVHRLDRDTSGVIVVAKDDVTHLALSAQFEQRTVEKQYAAIVCGVPDRDSDLIDLPIGAHPYQREKMAIRSAHPTARDATTFYQVERRFRGLALVRVTPKTGRTHQIRLHLAHIGYPVLCDRLYGGRAQITLGEIIHGREDGPILLARQALHAQRLQLRHPTTGENIEFTAPIPTDLQLVLDNLVKFRPHAP
jgi:23S rRNA pseudouridine1911/1915/1917 synthase